LRVPPSPRPPTSSTAVDAAELVEIIVVGERDEHAVYRDALARLTDNA